MEKVDILKPPKFEKSGRVKTLKQAWKDEDWIGTFNLWIIQGKPEPAIVYQQRSFNSAWAPGKLDVTAGGHYSAGENVRDGLREVKEELGKDYKFKDLTYLGRKLHVSPDVNGYERHNIVDIFMIKDDNPLASYMLQKNEVYAICSCPIEKLIKAHADKGYKFTVSSILSNGKEDKIVVRKSSFPYNWDNYHFKIALLADRFVKGEKHLLY
jgi:isopentenyldiphosphate isomerase